MFLPHIKSFKEGKISKEEFEEKWFDLVHSKPKKLSNNRVIPESWTTHPISKAIVELRNAAPVSVKKSITQCIQYSKMWWTKSTDTYLFPTYALNLFTQSLNLNIDCIILIDKKKSMNIYNEMNNLINPIEPFVKRIVASDQHTTIGALNGVGKKSPYAIPTFVLYHSAIRPYTLGKEQASKDYIEYRLPNLKKEFKDYSYANLKEFGEGKINEKELWDRVIKTMKEGMGLMAPTSYEYWNKTDFKPKRKILEGIHHTDERCHFHFKCTPLEDGWPLDSMISLLQKSIRRSNIFNSTWTACRILMFGLFHKKTTVPIENWCIYPSAQGKVTNLLNRILVITAEDIFPNAKVFYDVSSVIESCRKTLLLLKTPQPPDLYQERFYLIVQNVLSVIASLIQLPKQHYVGMIMFKHGKYYNNAKKILENNTVKEKKPVVKKRKRDGKITGYFELF